MAELKQFPFCGSSAIKKMSDVFELPVRAEQLEVYGANSDPKYSYEDIENAAAHAINMHDELVGCLQSELEFLQEAISQLTLKDALFGSIGERLVEVGELLSKARGE